MFHHISGCLMFVLLLAVVANAQDTAQEKLQQALLAEETKLIEAINKKDQAAIAELLTDQVMSITSRGRQTMAEVVRSLDQISLTGYKISNVRTISVTADVAILTYKFSWTGESTGQAPPTTNVYATSVWRQRDGRWRSVFYQETPMAQ